MFPWKSWSASLLDQIMKNYLLLILILLIAGCGMYLWANSISQKERLELLNGDYELVDWQIRPKSAIPVDSLTVYDILQCGERLTLKANDDGNFRMTTESSLPVLQQLAALEWQPLYIQRTWLAWRHSVIGQYHADEQSATVYWHRVFVNQTDVGITMQIADPTHENICWFLIFQKQ